MFNEQRKEAQLSGFAMAMHGYTPDTNAATKQPIYAWEDEPHKLKTLMQGLQQQQLTKAMDQEVNQLVSKIKQHTAATPDSAKWAPMPPQHHELLLPKVPLLAAAKSHPDFSSIATITTGATDHQSVACAEAVFCNPYYIEQVNLAGYPEAALLMLTFGRAYLAADQRGLTLEERAQFMHGRNVLIWQVCSLVCALVHMYTWLLHQLVLS